MVAPNDPKSLLQQTLPGGYRLERFIGAGAFAWVFYAVKGGSQPCAVKVLTADSTEARTLFTREIKILRQLPQNRYCVKYVGDGIMQQGTPFLAMEYIDGCTLKDALKFQGVWDVNEALKFGLQLCEALHGLHMYGLAHRDLKPENVMLTREWEVRLMDFGLVKDAQGLLKLFESEDILEGRDFAENIDKAMLAGTPEYMAPEQFSDPMIEDENQAKTDTWTDVYSTALILVQLLSGDKLFPFKPTAKDQRGYAKELLAYIRSRTEIKDSDLRRPASVPEGLWPVLLSALRPNPKQRPHNADAFADKLRQYLEQGEVDEFEDDEHTSVASMSMLLPVIKSASMASMAKAANAPSPIDRSPKPPPQQQRAGSTGPAMPPARPPAVTPGGGPPPRQQPATGPDGRPVDVAAVQAYREQRLNKPGGPDYTLPPGALHARDIPQAPPAATHGRSHLAQTASLPLPLVNQAPQPVPLVHSTQSSDPFGTPFDMQSHQSVAQPVPVDEPLGAGMKAAIAFALVGLLALVGAIAFILLHK
ncbi:MAG: protein kinase [Deltaproteobacteria bacterium]|nr:protein kinase [Deltaproteobacteria bacterium]